VGPPSYGGLECGLLRLQVLVLENVRFYKEETKNDPEFAKKVSPSPTASAALLVGTRVHVSSNRSPLEGGGNLG
jgi:hypothetical protein